MTERFRCNLLTYNLFIRPPGINNNGNDFKDERLRILSLHLDEFHVLAFQELFGEFSSRRRLFLNRIGREGFQFTNFQNHLPFRGMHLIGSGLATASKFPIEERSFSRFDDYAGVDGFAAKGIQYSKIGLLGNWKLHLFNLHLQATYCHEYQKTQHKGYESRLNQIASIPYKISNLLKLEPGRRQGVLLVGDFNVNANAAPLPNIFKVSDPRMREWLSNQGSTFSEYEYLLESISAGGKFKVTDQKFEHKKKSCHPVTFGAIKPGSVLQPAESTLTAKYDLCSQKSIDYIFRIHGPEIDDEGMNVDRCRVIEFRVWGYDDITHLSDHFGVAAYLSFDRDGIINEDL